MEQEMKSKIRNEYFIIFLVIYLELIFKLLVFKVYKPIDILYTIIFSVTPILIISLLCNIFKGRVAKVITIITTIVITIYFIIQTIFYKLFSVPFSFMTLGLAGNALDFTNIIADELVKNIFLLILFILPVILLIIFNKKIKFESYKSKGYLVMILAICVSIGITIGIANLDKKGTYSSYNLFYNINAQDKNIEKFGLLTSTGIDIQRTIFGFEEKVIIETGGELIETNEEAQTDEPPYEQEQEPEEIKYNEKDLQLENLIQSTTDKNLKNIYEYINNTEPTKKNEYTGYFKDKNLIFILAEGFNNIAVDKELTPTLYKLANSGFVFNNFYSPVFLSTTGGEFQAMTGLIPTQNTLNMWKKDMPQISNAIGNSFAKEGYTANAYHNWTYTYYSRNDTMKTLGFNSYMGKGNGLEKLMHTKWLPSDVDLINVTTDFYTSEDKFVTYYITVSGHAPYNFTGGNSISIKNKEFVKNLPYDDAVKAYLASQIELDRALETLINDLDEKGILQDTVIALVGDHYPYTLTIDEVNSVSSYERDDIVEVNRSNFILWNSEMEEPIQVNKVGSQIDVLPTLLNLFGIEYDSRTIIGKDILSDEPGIAIFSNRSWVTDYGTYYSKSKKFVLKDGQTVSDDYVSSINRSVANKFTMSNSFVKYDIYEKIGI